MSAVPRRTTAHAQQLRGRLPPPLTAATRQWSRTARGLPVRATIGQPDRRQGGSSVRKGTGERHGYWGGDGCQDAEHGRERNRRLGKQVGRDGDQADLTGQHGDERAAGQLSGGGDGQRVGEPPRQVPSQDHGPPRCHDQQRSRRQRSRGRTRRSGSAQDRPAPAAGPHPSRADIGSLGAARSTRRRPAAWPWQRLAGRSESAVRAPRSRPAPLAEADHRCTRRACVPPGSRRGRPRRGWPRWPPTRRRGG